MNKMQELKENKAKMQLLQEAIPRMLEYITDFDIENDEPYIYEVIFDKRGINVKLENDLLEYPYKDGVAFRFTHMAPILERGNEE